MKLDTARQYAQALLDACEQAEAEGRDALNKDDISVFSKLDDEARADLQAAIDSKSI
jgi:membrane peptidoglycan carboxypeptidase